MWKYNYNANSYTTKITHLETGSLGKTFVLELTIDKVNKFLKDYEKNVTLATVICTVEGM